MSIFIARSSADRESSNAEKNNPSSLVSGYQLQRVGIRFR